MPEQKQNLLIVDNDARSLRVLEVSLRKAGYLVTTATSMREALAIVKDNPPELIVSEVSFGAAPSGDEVANNLPVEDGYALLRTVRELPQLANTAFVFVTARTDVESKIRGLELGADEFLAKPIFAKEIVARLRLILQRRSRSKLEDAAGSDRTLFAGQLADMAVVDLLQTVEISRKSGILQLANGDGHAGTIYFQDGHIIDAETNRLVGERAVHRMLTWGDGSFEVAFREIERARRIEGSTQAVLMEGLRRVDEWNRICEQLPPLHHALDLDIEQLRRRLGDVPDEYNELLRLLDGRQAILAAVDASGVADLTALEQLAKLYFEGLLQDVGPAQAQANVEGARVRIASMPPTLPAEDDKGASARAPANEPNSVSFEEAFDGVPSRVTEPEQLAKLHDLAASTNGATTGAPSEAPQAASKAVYDVAAALPTKVPSIISPRRLKPNTAPLGEMPLRSARNPLDSLSPPISPATPRTITNKAAEIARANRGALEEFETDLATRQIVPLSQGQVLLAQLASTPAPSQDEPRQRLMIQPRSRRTGTLPGNNDPIPAAVVASGVPIAVPSSGGVMNDLAMLENTSAPRSARRRSALVDAAIVQAAVEPSGAIARSAGLVPEGEHVNEFVNSEVTEEMTDPGVGLHLQPRTMAGELPAPTASAAKQGVRNGHDIAEPLTSGAVGTLSSHDAVPAPSVVIDAGYGALPFPASPANPAQRVSKIKLEPPPMPRTITRGGTSEVKASAPPPSPMPSHAKATAAPHLEPIGDEGLILSEVNDGDVTELDESKLAPAPPRELTPSERREISVVTELSVSRVAPRDPNAANVAMPRTRARARETTGTSAYDRPKRRVWPWLVAGLLGAAVAVAISRWEARPTLVAGGLAPSLDAGAVAAPRDAGVIPATLDAAVAVAANPLADAAVAAVAEAPATPETPVPPDASEDDVGDAKAPELFRKYLSEARDRLAQSDLPRARLAIEKSLSEKRTARGLLVKADVLRRMGETSKAIATIDEALAMSAEYVAAWDAKGRVLWSIGRKAEARAAWTEYLRRRPEGDTADRIREILSQQP